MDFSFEKEFASKNNCSIIAGCDEVGRGSLAGPIIAVAVIFDLNKSGKGEHKIDLNLISKIKDSKKLTPKKRENLFDNIIKNLLCWAVGEVNNEEIDNIGIGEANRECVRRAIELLNIKPNAILFDYVPNLSFSVPYANIKKGDSTVISIASASILAKVYRDNLMNEFDKIYPMYNFKQNKAYGTKQHMLAIQKYGLCPIHRKSFKCI